ncbi:MAG: lysoplasmalogenase [Reichenbachiella sp.]
MKGKEDIYFKYGFIAICLLELVSIIFEIKDLMHVSKPLLMPALLVYFRKSTSGPINLSFILAALALVFSFVGDSVLMYSAENEIYFMIGLGAFAVAQLLYVFSFSQAVDQDSSELPDTVKVIYATPFVLLGLGLLWFLWPGLGALKIPVTVYASLIMTMAIYATYRNGRSSQESVNQVILGAVLFVLSDALIAINKFHSPMENERIFVMVTYMLAQWNIINGLQKHYNAQ